MEGTLSGFSLGEIIEMLAKKKKTGVLSIDSESAGCGRIWLQKGQVHSVETPAFKNSKEGDEKERRQIEANLKDAMVEIMEWEKSAYCFEAADIDVGEDDSLFEVDSLLAEVSKLRDEWQQVKAEIPSQGAKVDLISEMTETSVSLSREQWALVAAVGKTTTVDDLRKELNVSPFQIGRVLFGLSKAGLIRCLGKAVDLDAGPIKEEPRPKVEAIDKKYIRSSIEENDEANQLIPSEWASYYQLLDSRKMDVRNTRIRSVAKH